MKDVVIKVIGGLGKLNAVNPQAYCRPRPGYRFVFDLGCTDYDWLVVYDDVPRLSAGTLVRGSEPLRCVRARTILCTTEPVTIRHYSRIYTRQFGHLLTNCPVIDTTHPHLHLGRGYYFWFDGRSKREIVDASSPEKTKVISAVCSSKAMRHTCHGARLQLLKAMSEAIPELAWFGRGVRPLARKHEALAPSRYTVVAENYIAPHYWTEKLADAFLSECLPFYVGDPAIFETFPIGSLVPIPLDDPPTAVRIVQETIASNAWARQRGAVLEAKRRVLEKYNFFDQVIRVVESARNEPIEACAVERCAWVRSRHAVRWRRPAAALEYLGWRIARWVKS